MCVRFLHVHSMKLFHQVVVSLLFCVKWVCCRQRLLPPSVCTQVQSNSPVRTLIITVIAATCESTEGAAKYMWYLKRTTFKCCTATYSLGCSFICSLCRKWLIRPPPSPPQEEKSEIKTAITFCPKACFWTQNKHILSEAGFAQFISYLGLEELNQLSSVDAL